MRFQHVVFRRHQPIGSPPARGRLRSRSLTAVSCAAIALTLVTGCGATSPPLPAGTEVNGPVLTVVTAPLLDSAGHLQRIGPYFSASDSSVTAVALVGRVSGPTPLVMSWYRVSNGGTQLLFSKQLTVSSFDLAYTTADSAGTLPIGLYRVVASIGSYRRSVAWTTYLPKQTNIAQFTSTEKPLTLGKSGTFPAPTSPEQCASMESIVSMPSQTNVHINVLAYCPATPNSGPVRGAELATMNTANGLQQVGSLHLQRGGLLTGSFDLDVCNLPFGSDVPGASLYLTSIVYFHGATRDFASIFALPAEHAQPLLTVTSSVPPGTLVHPGERITLHIVGTEPEELGPQEGVRFLRLKGPTGKIAAKSFAPPRHGCGSARMKRTMTVTYTVPANAPKVLTLTAFAADTRVGGNSVLISFPVSG